MPAIPPLVDQFGNISLHKREDLAVPIKGGDNGVGLDLSTKTYFFEILGTNGRPVLRVPVGAHPTEPTWKLIKILAADLNGKIPSQGAEFVLLDETGGTAVPRWEGTIKRRGV